MSSDKPGVRTSEFWVMVIYAVFTEVQKFTGMEVNIENMALTWGPAMAYIVSRGIAKMKRE